MKLIPILSAAILSLIAFENEAFADSKLDENSRAKGSHSSTTLDPKSAIEPNHDVDRLSLLRAGELSLRIGNHSRVSLSENQDDFRSQFIKFQASLGLGVALSDRFWLELTLDRVEDDCIKEGLLSGWGYPFRLGILSPT